MRPEGRSEARATRLAQRKAAQDSRSARRHKTRAAQGDTRLAQHKAAQDARSARRHKTRAAQERRKTRAAHVHPPPSPSLLPTSLARACLTSSKDRSEIRGTRLAQQDPPSPSARTSLARACSRLQTATHREGPPSLSLSRPLRPPPSLPPFPPLPLCLYRFYRHLSLLPSFSLPPPLH